MNIEWVGSPNHYAGRAGYSVTHITLHIMVGYLTGTDATFANPSSGASAHYGIGPAGEIHQYVQETDGSYSDANYASNNSTISIEHQGGMEGVECTRACLDASAQLCADIARRYGWPKLWHDGLNGNIWLHREIPGTDHAACPDRAVNGLDVDYIINTANQLLAGRTGDDEMVYIIQPNDENGLWLSEGGRMRPILHPDEVVALQMARSLAGQPPIPAFKLGSNQAPFGTRFRDVINR